MSSWYSRNMPAPIKRPEGRLTFVCLPLEIQQQIVGRMSRKDLFMFQRLSSDCLALASAEIYRNLDLNLTNSGEEDNGLSTSHAADTLHTILASDQNYGKHIKSLHLGVIDDNVDVVGGHPGRSDPLLMTRLLWDTKSDSCKFLNTTLQLVARKTNRLETFQWDAPIEISGAVYQTLHKIESLRHLRVRLDVSPSPKMVIRHGLPSNYHPAPGANAAQTTNQFPNYVPSLPSASGIGSSSSGPYPGQSATKISNVKRKKMGGSGGYNYWANPRTFSGFKHLSTLSLMGMSNLDCLTEIAECIKASSATLNCLTLTLSTELARKARKPATVNPDLEDPSDTELTDDELLNDPLMPPTTTAVAQPPPTNEADIRKEKLAQESILATVFDLQSVALEGKKIEKNLSLWDTVPHGDGEVITRQFSTLMKSLLDEVALDVGSPSSETTMDRFKIIKEVAEMFISKQNLPKKAPKEQSKPAAPNTKMTGSKSKPLNPLATDFKASESSLSGLSAIHDWNSYLSSPTNQLFEATSDGSPSTTTPKHYPVSSLSTSTAVKPTAPASQQVSQLKQISNNPQKLAQMQLYQQMMYAQKLQKEQQDQMYYGAGTSPLPLSCKPYSPGVSGSPGLYEIGGGGAYTYNPATGATHSSTNGLTFGGPPSANYITNQAQGGLSNVSLKTKAKASKAKKKGLQSKPAVIVDSDEEMDAVAKTPPPVTQPFFAAETPTEPLEDAMDVDMEHPDEETQELGEDQEVFPETEENEVPTPRKRAKIGSMPPNAPVFKACHGSSSADQAEVITAVEALTSEEEMQAYIRTAHGLHLETLALEWVPLKPSIVARALDLSILRHVTLLEVGPQDAFWTLLARLQRASPEIAFRSIHTDNVSQPFVKFLATFEGLEELFMHERALKQGEDAVAALSVSTSTIRKLVLQRHISTLRRLMIRNERNELWDVDTKTLQLLAVKGTKLRELAISLSMKTYHVLMQYFAAFKSLYALHLVALRSTDRNMGLQTECLNFALDSLSHCRDMKIRYVAIVGTVVALESKPEQFKRQITTVIERRKDKKGKGKAPTDTFSSFLDHTEDSGSDEIEDALAEVITGESKLRIPTGFTAVDDVKIFSRQMRGGRL